MAVGRMGWRGQGTAGAALPPALGHLTTQNTPSPGDGTLGQLCGGASEPPGLCPSVLLLELSCLGDLGMLVRGGRAGLASGGLVAPLAFSPPARALWGPSSVLAVGCCPSPPRGHSSVTPSRQRVLPVPPGSCSPPCSAPCPPCPGFPRSSGA